MKKSNILLIILFLTQINVVKPIGIKAKTLINIFIGAIGNQIWTIKNIEKIPEEQINTQQKTVLLKNLNLETIKYFTGEAEDTLSVISTEIKLNWQQLLTKLKNEYNK